MADVSKVKLPNNSVYNLKDKTQTRSDHRHYDSDLVPLVSKTYASTSYYSTNDSWDNSTWYFMSIKPDAWYKPWRVKFKVHSFCPSYESYHSYTWSTICGRSDGIIYANWNERQNTAHYYIGLYPLKKAGFDAGYGHALGVSIRYGDNYTNSNYYRTFEVDYYECENCTVTILDTPVKWANWSGTGTTYYNSISTYDAVNRGLRESGDDNTIENQITYFAGKTGAKGIWAASLFMEDANGTYQNICTATDGTVTSSNRTTGTKVANTNGFKVGGCIYYTNTNYNANTNISGWGVIYKTMSVLDSRYSLNTTLTANCLTPYTPVYLVGTINASDGLFYLDSTWWTQTPTDTSKVYVLIGGCYDSTTSYCRITLYEENPWYRYDGSRLVIFSGNDITKLPLAGGTMSGDIITPRNDNLGIKPYSNNWGEIGHSNLYFYRSYITNYYGTTSHVTNWDSNSNIGTPSSSSGASTLGLVNFYNTCVAGGTQTKTSLSADSTASSNVALVLPKTSGTLALTSDIVNTTYTLGTSGNTVTLTPSSGSVQSITVPYATSAGSATKATQDESGNNIKATYANSFSISDHTITLKNKNGDSLGTVTVPDNDTKNTAGSTDTSSKIFLIGATSQATNPQTYSDDQVYATSGTLQTNNTNATVALCANTAGSQSAGGLSLYSTNQQDTYGVIFRGTGNKGKHGYVQADWATYFTMNPTANRGWVFNNSGVGNVASISNAGYAVFNGSVTIGGNATNTSGARMEFNSTTQAIDFVFV